MKFLIKHLELFIILLTVMGSIFCSLLISEQISSHDTIVTFHKNYTVLEIFINNFLALLIIVLGVLTLGLSSLVVMFLNLMNIGIYFWYTLETTSLQHTLYLTVFHGSFELVGLFLGYYVSLFLVKSYIINRTVNIGKAAYLKVLKLVIVATIFLLIAAFIEIIILG
ncbi:stage II sporulation protein M [Streptococcus saliviloxodontae]|nr:stage II sporulation protein M [Streptococcus saliviloxodontae]